MKLQFKHQKFQEDAARAVVDVFRGQPCLSASYLIDMGESAQTYMEKTGWNNAKIVPALTDEIVLQNLQRVQQENMLAPSPKLEGKYNLTIEMETGVGKTYTYTKTMYELNKAYGWSKFIIIVPSIAIREGVYKSLQVTQEHFAEEYGKKIRFFIYNSARLSEIESFASDSSINVMIINSQAFNAKGKDARRIKMRLDEFRSRRPIDVIAKTNPVLIIDEPQSVEGKQTKENLKDFNPLLTLRYSATHKKDSIYNMVYRLDAMDAYNKRLVKKIAVKGFTRSGSDATESFVYLQSVNLSKSAPTATIQFDCKTESGKIKQVTRTVGEKYNLYPNSGELEEYKNGFTVKFIDGRDNSIEFLNGIKLIAGEVNGNISEENLRKIQIKETILSHIEREKQLFNKGIKVLSLFFIDEVAHYKEYDEQGNPQNGIFAQMFEEAYQEIIESEFKQKELLQDKYYEYLKSIDASSTHAGYFSIDKKGRMVNSKVSDKKENTSDDIDAYDLIMKNKELLLEINPKKSPVRFIFSHSALREGWDNPNVFQICTLKHSSSEMRKHQEIGRGLRLCVNQAGERMDTNSLGNTVHDINLLTVIASESYTEYTKNLQAELAESIVYRPKSVTAELFVNKTLKNENGETLVIDKETANSIYLDLFSNKYIDKKGIFTQKYHDDKANNKLVLSDEVKDYADDVIKILESVYDPGAYQPEDSRKNNVTLKIDRDKLAMPEFKALWAKINSKSAYVVDFDGNELVKKTIEALNRELIVSKVFYRVDWGTLNEITSKEDLNAGILMAKEEIGHYDSKRLLEANKNVKYDLVGKIVELTKLTRKDVVEILKGLQTGVFNQFKNNPEEFINTASRIINEQKATAVIEHITYNMLDEKYDTDIFTDHEIKGKLNVNAIKTSNHIYDHVVYDSENEKVFAENLDATREVAVYAKLPDGFYISTPVGKYNPDWAIAFKEGNVKHIYFVAETKGDMSSMQLRLIEDAKIHCAREHFKAISGDNIVYDVIDSYETLMKLVRG